MKYIGYSLAKTLEIQKKSKGINELRTVEESYEYIISEAKYQNISLYSMIYNEKNDITLPTLFSLIVKCKNHKMGLYIDFNSITRLKFIYLITILVENKIPFIDIKSYPHIPQSTKTDFYKPFYETGKKTFSIDAKYLGAFLLNKLSKYKIRYNSKYQYVLVGKHLFCYVKIKLKNWYFEIDTSIFFHNEAKLIRNETIAILSLYLIRHKILILE